MKHKYYWLTLVFAFLALVIFYEFYDFNCPSYSAEEETATTDSTDSSPQDVSHYPVINYTLVKIDSLRQLSAILRKYSDSVQKEKYYRVLKTLIRREIRFFGKGSRIIIPDTIIDDMRAYSVFPQNYPGAIALPKLIMVDANMQAYGCYEHGKLVRFAAVNSGKERTPSYPGRYAVNWKQRFKLSSLDSNWKLPFTVNFHQEAGSAFHQFDMPGRPVSHSCVRQFLEDAEWLFKWVKTAKFVDGRPEYMTGTPVVILNTFDYTRKIGGPWHDLKSNRDGIVALPDNPMAVEEALIPISQIPRTSRGVLRNRQRYETAEDTLRARGVIRPGVTITPSVDFNHKRRVRKAAQHKELMKKNTETENSSQ